MLLDCKWSVCVFHFEQPGNAVTAYEDKIALRTMLFVSLTRGLKAVFTPAMPGMVQILKTCA